MPAAVGALAAVSAVMAGGFTAPTGARGNLFLGLALPPSSGKEDAKRLTNDVGAVVAAQGLSPRLGGLEVNPSNITSEAGLHEVFLNSRVVVAVKDEVGLRGLTTQRSGDPHQSGLATFEMEVFSMAGGSLGARYYASSKNNKDAVAFPYYVRVQMLQPSTLSGVLPDVSVLGNGTITRTLWFASQDKFSLNPPNQPPWGQLPDHVRRAILRIAAAVASGIDPTKITATPGAPQKPGRWRDPYKVRLSEDAERLDAAKRAEMERRYHEKTKVDLSAAWGRAVEQAHRLALVLAVGEAAMHEDWNPETILVSADTLDVAYAVVEESIALVASYVETTTAGPVGSDGAIEESIIRALRSGKKTLGADGGLYINKSALISTVKNSRDRPSTKVNFVLKSMLDAGVVEAAVSRDAPSAKGTWLRLPPKIAVTTGDGFLISRR